MVPSRNLYLADASVHASLAELVIKSSSCSPWVKFGVVCLGDMGGGGEGKDSRLKRFLYNSFDDVQNRQ